MCSSSRPPFCIQQGSIIALPVLHYTMEMAAEVKRLFDLHQPDCVAVEMAESLQPLLLRAAGRLPDISLVKTYIINPAAPPLETTSGTLPPNNPLSPPLYYMAEPCDASFEALRLALDHNKSAFCIDLDIENYPEYREAFPDPYAITHMGYAAFYAACRESRRLHSLERSRLDQARELHMARRLKELTLCFDKVLFVAGMHHVESVLEAMQRDQFPPLPPPLQRESGLYTLTEESCREGMAECGWMTLCYEEWRKGSPHQPLPDRQRMLYQLFDVSRMRYCQESGNAFPSYHLRNVMKFSRNYALIGGRLMPDLYRLVTAARGCVDSNYGYEVWKTATEYPLLRNVDSLEALSLTPEELWGASKMMRFRLKEPRRKGYDYVGRKKREGPHSFKPSHEMFLCSYPPEDIAVERFGEHVKKRSMQLMLEEQMRIIPFSTSLEEGIDLRETIRHWHEKKLYVRKQGRPTGQVGAIVVIFDVDSSSQNEEISYEDPPPERYPWKMTWIGEHSQESDMAFYATPLGERIVGPGISRSEHGGFMLSYPPGRLRDVWRDEDYSMCTLKAEVLLMSAVDYSLQPVIVYIAEKPPAARMKTFAARFGKKIFYIPISQFSPPVIQKMRVFHVLDGRNRRDIAGDYIN